MTGYTTSKDLTCRAPDFSTCRGKRGLTSDVTIVGGGPTGLMLAGDLAWAGVDVAILERLPTPDLLGARARGFHSRPPMRCASPRPSADAHMIAAIGTVGDAHALAETVVASTLRPW